MHSKLQIVLSIYGEFYHPIEYAWMELKKIENKKNFSEMSTIEIIHER